MARYYMRKGSAYAIASIALIALAVLMEVFAGQIGVVEPRLYVTATDNRMELAARFVVPVRTARSSRTM
jgi:hypothetical protein